MPINILLSIYTYILPCLVRTWCLIWLPCKEKRFNVWFWFLWVDVLKVPVNQWTRLLFDSLALTVPSLSQTIPLQGLRYIDLCSTAWLVYFGGGNVIYLHVRGQICWLHKIQRHNFSYTISISCIRMDLSLRINRIDDVMVICSSRLSSAIDRGFESSQRLKLVFVASPLNSGIKEKGQRLVGSESG